MTVQERLALLLVTAATLAGQAHALPQGPNTVATSGANPTFTPGAGTLTIDQSSERTVIDWGSFSIAPGETVTFNMPGGTSIAVNRVPFCAQCSVPPLTVIDGALVSNGNVWVLDPRGVFFGPTAQVDVHGLLASPADLLDINAFVNGALGDPIAFSQDFGPASVSVAPGAQIVVRGGPAMFISSLDATGGGVLIGGTVSGGGTAEESASSQVLYGAAQSFTLRFSATPPSAMRSSDLQLFDFIIDSAVPRTQFGFPSDVIDVAPGSVTSAGSVFVAAAAAAPDGSGDDPARILIGGVLESTSGPLIVNGAGGVVGGVAGGLLADAEIDVVFERAAFETGPSSVELEPLVELRAAGGLDIAGRSILALQSANVGEDFPPQPVPDHLVVQFSNTSTSATPTLVMRARGDVFLQNTATALAGPNSRAIDIIGATVTVQNSLGAPVYGDVMSAGPIVISENAPLNGAPPPPTPVDFTFGALTTAAAGVAPVSIMTRGVVKAGAISAGAVSVNGGTQVALGDLAAISGAISLASLGDISVGGATAQTLLVNAGPTGDVLFTGPVVLGGGPGSAPVMQIFAGDAVTFNGAVSTVGDVFISAGGDVRINAPFRVTGATGPSMTSTGIATLGGFDLRAGDVHFDGTLFVRGAPGVGINFTLANAGAGNGVHVTTDDVQRLDAPFVALRLTNNAEIVFEDVILDAAQIGRLIVATNGIVRVQGTVTGIGAPELFIGEGALLPSRIEISGSLGTLAGPLGRTALTGAGPILFGTQAFLTALQSANLSTIDLAQFAGGFGGAQANQLFLVAGPTTISTQGAVLQQNTGGLGFDGVRLTAPGGTVGSGVLGGAPTRVVLFGQITDSGGVTVSGPPAAAVNGLLANGVSASSAYRFNGCIIGQSCAAATTTSFDQTSLKALPPPQPSPQDGGLGPAASPSQSQAASQARRSANRTMSAIEVDSSASELGSPEEAREERDPGVGAANEDLWPTQR